MCRKGDLNVLISTSVVEEGLDVRKCNLIVRYDFPETFRSYVQVVGPFFSAQKTSLLSHSIFVVFTHACGTVKLDYLT